jgi:DNA invertase Pin-like site-specific DNA recombinase
MKEKALTYVRVSKEDDPRMASIETQEAAAIRKAEEKGFEVPPEYRFRERFTGMESIRDRDELMKARALVAQGKVKGFCCYDTDRLARDPGELTVLCRANADAGVETFFVQLDQNIETRVGQMVLYMKGFASAVEWDQLRDRTMRGRQWFADKGLWVGGGPPKYGYVWDLETRTRSACPETAPVVQQIFGLVLEGFSSCAIARQLNEEEIPCPSARRGKVAKDGVPFKWLAGVICKMIHDETYMGKVVIRQTRKLKERTKSGARRVINRPASERMVLSDARTDALVTPDAWKRANKRLANGKSRSHTDGNGALLGGHIWCANCGSRMHAISRLYPGAVNRLPVYRCSGNLPYRARRTGCNTCLGAKWVDREAWAAVSEFIFRDEVLEHHLAALRDEPLAEMLQGDLKVAESLKQKAETRIGRVIEALEEIPGPVARKAIREKIADLEREVATAQEQIEAINERITAASHIDNGIASIKAEVKKLRRLLSKAEEIPLDLKRDALKWLGIKVKARKGEITEVKLDYCVHVSPSTGGQRNAYTIVLVA